MMSFAWYPRCRLNLCLFTALTIVVSQSAVAAAEIESAPVDTEAVSLLQQYIRIDTINPPGNETRAVEFLAGILEAEGIDFETSESAPGRGNIWARIEGGDEPALLLLHHMDVVQADASFWEVPPLSGAINDGYIYGRGALDMKSQGILHLVTFLALHRAGLPLNRDVIFMGTADEEAGSEYGMAWMVENRPEIFADVGLALTEGGQGTIVGDQIAFGVQVTEKVPLWLRLEATGQSGHGSTPGLTSSVDRLIGALTKIRAHRFEPRIIPIVDAYFKSLADRFPASTRAAFLNIDDAITDQEFMHNLHKNLRMLHALTQNTCAITRLEGSEKINVIPQTASAELDCRLLPDEDPDRFVEQLISIIDDGAISVSPLISFSPSISSTDTELFAAIEVVIGRHFPGIDVAPSISAGFTDSHHLRALGIVSYGFAPVLIPVQDLSGYHGANERISVENIDRGASLLLEIVQHVSH
jgi:acetylornithine deacetylase/succinyl-diaminopimelate desuccinylase-like protein